MHAPNKLLPPLFRGFTFVRRRRYAAFPSEAIGYPDFASEQIGQRLSDVKNQLCQSTVVREEFSDRVREAMPSPICRR